MQPDHPYASDPTSPFEKSAVMDTRPVPKFGIAHLFLLTAAAALLTYPTRGIMQSDFGPDERFRYFMIGHQFVIALLMAVPVASLGGWALSYRRGERFPAAPGHWLLIMEGVGSLMLSLFGWFWMMILDDDFTIRDGLETLIFVAYAGVTVVMGSLLLVVAFSCIRESRWRVAFILLAIAAMANAAQYIFIYFMLQSTTGMMMSGQWIVGVLSSLAQFTAFGSIVVMAIMDLRDPERRDWIHWTGIVCYLLMHIVNFAWNMIAPMLL